MTSSRGHPRRIFVGWSAPTLHRAVQLLVDRPRARAGSTDLPLNDILLALPGRRAGRRLLELLLDAAEARGLRLLPPEVTTLGALPERLYHPPDPAPDPVLERAAWRAALGGASTEDRAVLLARAEERHEKQDEAWLRLAGTLRTLHREVAAGGWTFREVAEHCDGELYFDDEARWRALARIQERYETIVEGSGRMDREKARRRALSEGRAATDREVWVVAAVDVPPVLRRFVLETATPTPPTVVIPAPEERASAFDEVGRALPEAWSRDDLPDLEDRVRVVDGPADQVEAVIGALAGLEEALSPEQVTLGSPDPEVSPYLAERMAWDGVPAREPPGRPVERTALFRLLQAASDYLEDRNFEAFASLIRHPTVEAALRNSGPEQGRGTEAGRLSVPSLPALSDAYHALHLPTRLDSGTVVDNAGWELEGVRSASGDGADDGEGSEARPHAEAGRARPGRHRWTRMPAPTMARLLDELELLLEPLTGGEHPTPSSGRRGRKLLLKEWGEPLRRFLVSLHGTAPLDRRREADRETLEVAERIREVLDVFTDLSGELDPGPVSAHRALGLLLEELRWMEPVPPETSQEAVEILGWLELPLDDAPVLAVTGMNEPHVPEAVTADPFLPHELRQRLGLLDNQGRWARDLLHLRVMFESRDELTLVTGRRDAQGNPLRPSRLLLGGSAQEVARKIQDFLGGTGGKGKGEEDARREPEAKPDRSTPTSAAEASRAEPDGARGAGGSSGEERPPRTFHLPPEPTIRDAAPPDRIRVTAFRRLLQAPYLYALESILGLEAVHDRDREMDGAAFGSLGHRVLQRWGEADGGLSDPLRIAESLRDHLEAEFRSRFGTAAHPAVRIQKEQLGARLSAFARWQAERRSQGWEIVRVEAEPPGPGVGFTVDGSDILLRGKIDRMDRHSESGRWQLLDYKIGDRVRGPDEVHRQGRGEKRWVDLQLPLYRHLARALRSPGDDGPLIAAEEEVAMELGYVALPRDRERVGLLKSSWSGQDLKAADETARAAVRLLRENVFRYEAGTIRLRDDDPLAPILGQGVLAPGEGPDG